MLENESLFSLSIDNASKGHLLTAAKWARFLGITGMVLLALWIIAMIFGINTIGSTYTRFTVNGERAEAYANTARITLISFGIIGGLIAFFPMLFLVQFGNRAKEAIITNQQESLIRCFQELKKYFRYLGIITLILVIIYGLFFLLMFMGLAVAGR